jgi:hypothetical protein
MAKMRGGGTMVTCCNILMLLVAVLVIMYILGYLDVVVLKEGFKGVKYSPGAIFGIFIASIMAFNLLIGFTHDGTVWFKNIATFFGDSH